MSLAPILWQNTPMTRTPLMRNLLLALATWLLTSLTAWAEPPILSVPDAQAQMEAGDLVLLDIRSRQEWRETGVAQGAWLVSMHERDFGERLQAILAVHPPENIAVICATGGRTARVTRILERNGLTGIADVSEGMMGNRRGPGWIARGLKVVPLEEAEAAFEAATADW